MKFRLKRLKRLSHKFITGVVLILLATLAGTWFANSKVVERFYLHSQREYLQKISAQLEFEIKKGTDPDEIVQKIEKTEKVLIVYSEKTDNPEQLANELREAFKQKGLGFQKFWMWEKDYQMTVQNGSRFRLYSQDKMNYSILVQYISLSSGLYAVAAIVPDAQGFIKIINHISFLIYTFAILIAIILIYVLTKHITNPLTEVTEFTKRISANEYQPLQIRTGDELEAVANSLNEMLYGIEQYQKLLKEKNEQMEQLLSNVAHDLKTPISLVGIYAAGMKDGLDDGTFLDTIIRQNGKMSQIAEKLLQLSRIERKEQTCEKVALDKVLLKCIEEQECLFVQRGLEISKEIESDVNVLGDEELLGELFSNLLSNAAKYASDGCVKVKLYRLEEKNTFQILNKTENVDLDINNIWKPFYVGESSRNKELSGTGLGLSIVKKVAEQFYYNVSCVLKDNEICFEVDFPHI